MSNPKSKKAQVPLNPKQASRLAIIISVVSFTWVIMLGQVDDIEGPLFLISVHTVQVIYYTLGLAIALAILCYLLLLVISAHELFRGGTA